MSQTFKVDDIVRVTAIDPEVDFGYDVGDVARITEVRHVGTRVEPPIPILPVIFTEEESYEVEWISNKRAVANDNRATNMYPHEIELVS